VRLDVEHLVDPAAAHTVSTTGSYCN
jgi:hypothetical protein